MRTKIAILALAAGLLSGAAVPVFAARGGTGKSLVCHRGHTINVSNSAVPAHLRHGDTLGACVAAGTPTPTPAQEATPTTTAEPTATGTLEPAATDTPEATATATLEEPTATATEVVITGLNQGRHRGH